MMLDDWSIFCKYNYRVHSLHHDMRLPSRTWIGTEIWGTFGCPPFSLPLLPNLRSLTWDIPSEIFSYIRWFVTQKLTTLDIHTSCSEFKFSPSVQSILSYIPMLCPSLSNFHFHNQTESGDASIALQRWSHLISASTGKISDATILYLSNLPSLRELHIELHHPTPIAADTQKLLQRPAFCALQELGVTCESLATSDAFFETLSIAPKILSFRIDGGEDSPSALLASISRISNACAHSALEHLQILVLYWNDPELNVSITAATFQPLCAFHNLRKLDFQSNYDVQLDDVALLRTAKAWPLLEELAIHGQFNTVWGDYPRLVTPDGFVSLLKHCPRLTSVAIVINWSAVDRRGISPEIPYQGFAHGALSYADFDSSTIRHVIGIAAFLSSIAPKLEEVVGWDADYHTGDADFKKYSRKWNDVHHLVKAFSIVREQGRGMALDAGVVVDDVGGSADDSREDSASDGEHP
ncbi:hypothetical protein K503DRAFT_777319 [Rhizopogon vinicolor AM-OR11-026]|uniref:F-box domain-containing protein n=1 Tax=Rhizopogon vinicolor AM-OR11-026 TaxID=1314800 RepID=A0A1B7MGM4_9AGAM|nr:hypothetical protein K503DRAFT_777319 [Rhizopogon vinicolor AM-OR11-026]